MKKRSQTISRRTLAELRRRLLDRQRVLFREVDDVEGDLASLEDSREAEIEERGQREAMARLLDRIGEHDRREIEDIHRALAKIPAGAYGRCEHCGQRIAVERLKATPAARRCLECEAEQERRRGAAPGPVESASRHALPPEYRDLDDEELAAAVRDRLRAHGDPDLRAVAVHCHGGTVRLTGRVPSEAQRQVLRQIIVDGMGLAVVDRLRSGEIERELPGESERPAGEVPSPAEDRIPAGHGMRPLGDERWSVPEDEGEPPEDAPDEPIPEKH